MTHIVQMPLSSSTNLQILDTFRQTMKIEDSARGNALQTMTEKFNLGAMFGDARNAGFRPDAGEYGRISPAKSLRQCRLRGNILSMMTSPRK